MSLIQEECLKRHPDAKVIARLGGYAIQYLQDSHLVTSLIKKTPNDAWRAIYHTILWKERVQ